MSKVSLLGKWLKSPNTSSKESRRLARLTYQHLGITERTYRKTLSELRKYLDVVEKKMSAQRFDTINYEGVPSVAMTRYRSCFGKHDFERFNEYIHSVTKGEAKINSSVSYPYDLIAPYTKCRSRGVDPVLEAQWKALPNYVEGNHNVVVMADVSGSMSWADGRPMDTSVSLGIYFAERNTGAYHNLVMSFTDKATMFELSDNATLASKVKEVMSHVGYNTNLDAAFRTIYDMAQRCGEAPEALVIISDGEIDNFTRTAPSIVARWQDKYAQIGMEAPKLIMWNVESRGARYLDTAGNTGISYVSGSSASTFRELTKLISMNAVEAMTAILTKEAFRWK